MKDTNIEISFHLDKQMIERSAAILAEEILTLFDYHWSLVLFGEFSLQADSCNFGYLLQGAPFPHTSILYFINGLERAINNLSSMKSFSEEIRGPENEYCLRLFKLKDGEELDCIISSDCGTKAVCTLSNLKNELNRAKLSLLREVANFEPKPLMENLTRLDNYIEGVEPLS